MDPFTPLLRSVHRRVGSRHGQGPSGITLCCGACVLMVGVIAFAFSWSAIGPTQYGIKYNDITGTIDTSNTYTPGRWFVGLYHQFLLYPSNLQSIEFSTRRNASATPVDTRTNNGIPISISFSFQYKLMPHGLVPLYQKYGPLYQPPLIKVARNYVLRAASNYDSSEYWIGRKEITDEMLDLLKKNIEPNFGVHVSMLQLLNVTLPQSYEDSIVQTQVQIQQTQISKYTQQVKLIEQGINQMVAEANSSITTISADAHARAIHIENVAAVEAFKYGQKVKVASYKELCTNLHLDSKQCLEYLKLKAINQAGDNSAGLKIGLSVPEAP